MTSLSSNLDAQALPTERLPAFKAHHDAKHSLLREYMHVWLPKLGYTYKQIAIVDGFASAGRYREGNPGSPLVMLQAYAGWKDFQYFKSPPHFVFIESNESFAKHLQHEVDSISDLRGATVDVIHGRYEDQFPAVIEYLATTYAQPIPTFAFVDPLGWKDNPFNLIQSYRKRLGEKAEALIYVPAAFMARFAEQDFVQASLGRLYGGPSFTEAQESGDEAIQFRASESLAEAYRERLKTEFDWVTRFRIDPVRRNEYYLLFGTGHMAGLRAMKSAMWKVDPVGGQAYEQSAKAAAGQDQLFSFAEVESLPSEEALPTLLRGSFGDDVFSVEEAAEFVLTQTRYLDSPHLRRLALKPLEDAGHLELINPSPTRRKSQFPPGTRMRITS